MAQLVQSNGDYTIRTSETGTITLDTGNRVGEVIVTGNLQVRGDTLTVSAENLNVNDNVIILNYGETGSGVSLRYSGIQIDRGSLTAASFYWDENDDTFNLALGSPEGVFSFADSKLKLREIQTNTATDSGDLSINAGSGGVVKLISTGGNYHTRVTDDNDIPNKRYVDDSIRDNPTFQIIDDNTRVIITDKEVAGSETYLIDNTGYDTGSQSAVSVIVDGYRIAEYYSNRINLGGLEIGGGDTSYEITTRAGVTNENIYVRTQGTGRLQTNYALELEKIAGSPAYTPNSLTFYAKEPGSGDSGLFFTNSLKTDELISKNRALLFGMIF